MMGELTDILLWLKAMDTFVFLMVNGHHNAYFDSVMWLISDKWVWLPMYVSLLYVLLKNYSYKAVFSILIAIGLIILFTDCFTSQIVRPWIGRLRPSNLDNPVSKIVHVVDGYRGGAYGFPSNHASNTWGLTFFVTFLFRRWRLALFFCFWALFTCYSRMYLGVHYFGDILIGCLFALVGASVSYVLFRKLSGNPHVEKLEGIYIPMWTGGMTILIIMIVSIFYRV